KKLRPELTKIFTNIEDNFKALKDMLVFGEVEETIPALLENFLQKGLKREALNEFEIAGLVQAFEIIHNILRKYPYSFYAYGSRVKGEARRLSDLDICYQEDIPLSTVSLIKEEFEESNLPFEVEVQARYQWEAVAGSSPANSRLRKIPILEMRIPPVPGRYSHAYLTSEEYRSMAYDYHQHHLKRPAYKKQLTSEKDSFNHWYWEKEQKSTALLVGAKPFSPRENVLVPVDVRPFNKNEIVSPMVEPTNNPASVIPENVIPENQKKDVTPVISEVIANFGLKSSSDVIPKLEAEQNVIPDLNIIPIKPPSPICETKTSEHRRILVSVKNSKPKLIADTTSLAVAEPLVLESVAK
ncbi:6806_t:CDS:2, partial [Racocetra persica]